MPTNAIVAVTYDPTAKPPLSVSPSQAYVYGPGNVTWNVAVPAGTTVTIAFTNGCPFPPVGEQPTGSYQSAGQAISTQDANPNTNGTYAYTITTNNRAGGAADGGIVVQNNP